MLDGGMMVSRADEMKKLAYLPTLQATNKRVGSSYNNLQECEKRREDVGCSDKKRSK